MKTSLIIIFILAFYSLNIAQAAICKSGGYCLVLTSDSSGSGNSELAAIFNPKDPPEKIFASLFDFLLAFVGIGAMVMIVVEGIKYMASGGDRSKIEDAKRRIWNAIWGLVLALISYLLLQTINPDLIKPGLKTINLKEQKGLDVPTDEAGRPLGTPGSSVIIGKPGQPLDPQKKEACLAKPGCEILTTGAGTIDCDCGGVFKGVGGP